ncbi:hypothetical protein [Bacillus niameyensis]|uniref:hypothetical protein n=1 Tax=Bacillus niameyensis TaxID=1522308 RepID=UPI0007863850|nr:hypothetical protein [Bacillus niameyensis]
MIYQTRILKAWLHPQRNFIQLANSEIIRGMNASIIGLLLASGFVFFLSGWFGIGTHVLSPTLVESSKAEFASLKSFFLVGRTLLGFIYAGLIITLPSLCFWTFTHVDYSKLVAIQIITLPILLLEQLTFIFLAISFDLPWYSSPLSLGVIAQYFISKNYVIYLLGSISFFKIWVMVIQYYGLRELSKLSRLPTFLMVLFLNLVGWCLTATLAFINFVILL